MVCRIPYVKQLDIQLLLHYRKKHFVCCLSLIAITWKQNSLKAIALNLGPLMGSFFQIQPYLHGNERHYQEPGLVQVCPWLHFARQSGKLWEGKEKTSSFQLFYSLLLWDLEIKWRHLLIKSKITLYQR